MCFFTVCNCSFFTISLVFILQAMTAVRRWRWHSVPLEKVIPFWLWQKRISSLSRMKPMMPPSFWPPALATSRPWISPGSWTAQDHLLQMWTFWMRKWLWRFDTWNCQQNGMCWEQTSPWPVRTFRAQVGWERGKKSGRKDSLLWEPSMCLSKGVLHAWKWDVICTSVPLPHLHAMLCTSATLKYKMHWCFLRVFSCEIAQAVVNGQCLKHTQKRVFFVCVQW